MADIRSITYEGVVAITGTNSGSANYAFPLKPAAGFMVNVAGNIAIVTALGQSVTLTVNAGVIYPIAIKTILATGTTASGLFALMSLPHTGQG